MTHRRELIMAKVETLLTGLPTTGSRIFRARALPLERDTDLPAFLLFQGPDLSLEQHTPDNLTVDLEVFLDGLVAITGQGETILNQMEQEATHVLLDKDGTPPDYQLGLETFVRQIVWRGTDETEIEGEGDRAMLRQRSLWVVTYERSRTDPSN